MHAQLRTSRPQLSDPPPAREHRRRAPDHGATRTRTLFGRTVTPEEIAPRILAENALVAHILDQIPEPRVRTVAATILAHLRVHGVATQAQINHLPGGLWRLRVPAEVAGDRAVARAESPLAVVNARVGVAARTALTRLGVVRGLRRHSAGRHSAVYGLDLESLVELRASLGLPEVRVE